ncbi:type II toxin-antitoxin system VapB family antitoxin [Sphingomonas sp. GlSt437]|uniref:type II toxin-antitoxin system VapB family antitoxin n=1 Tax=Sphingomonas sp. GlSt437 TaxID=3389970 RepID=UPI003A869008
MALSIKDAQTDRLVRQYARLHGTSYTGAIRRAVTEALEREGQKPEPDAERAAKVWAAIRDVQARIAAAPILDDRHPDEILYDADGLPH